MKKTKLSVAITLLATTHLSAAEETKSFWGITPSASVALTTDYVWRGVSQSRNDPAIQGSFGLTHESGLYVGVWGSNVEFGDHSTSMELDAYGGFSGETDFGGSLPLKLGYDLGVLRYEYTGQPDLNFTELYFGASASPFENFNLSTYYYYGLKIEHTLPGEYTDISADYTLPDALGGITILGHAGYYNQKGGLDNYWDWKVGVAKDLGGFNFEVAYTDTDDADAGNLDDSKVVATISRTLGESHASDMLPDSLTASASVALTTDYIWRGVSQTNNEPAIQGSVDLAHDSGAYIGVWGSNVEFGDDTSLELDIYAGFSNAFNIGSATVTYDVGWLRYEYPAESSLNFNELYGGLSFSPVENLNFGAKYYYGLRIEHTHPGDYRDFSIDYTLPEEVGAFTLLGHAGQYDVVGGDDYWDWKVGVAKDLGPFNIEVAYTDTDDTGSGLNTDDSKVVGTLSASF